MLLSPDTLKRRTFSAESRLKLLVLLCQSLQLLDLLVVK